MIYHCKKCHHEWQTVTGKHEKKICDWCGAKGKPIAKDYTDQIPDRKKIEDAWRKFFEEHK
jgi:hypothetical protein